jgi:hypothetical protein
MSRALYHLSYGTARERLPRRLLDPSLQLALLLPMLGDRYTLSLVHFLCAHTSGRKAGVKLVAEVGFEPTTFGL